MIDLFRIDSNRVNKHPFLRGLQRVANNWRLAGPLASDPTATMLHALLLSVVVWFAFWSVVIIPLYPHRGIRLWMAVLQEIGPVTALIVLRAGFFRWASLTYLIGTLVFANVGAVFNGGVTSSTLKYELMMPIVATWLLGYRAAIWTTVACMSSAFVMTILQITGVKFGSPVTTPLGGLVTHFQIILVGVVPVAQIWERLKGEIAERERKERALSESEQRFRNMADTAPMEIIVLDEEGRATFINKTWLTFTGRSVEEGLGDGWTSAIHPDDCDECLSILRDSHKNRSHYQLEYRLRRSDGQYRSVLCIGRPRYEPDGTLAGFIQSLLDVTDLKQALANQKLESLGVLAGGIAHDFNNLLGAIRAQAELASWELDAGSSCREELKAIGEVAVRGSDIVRQLMIHAGKETEDPEPVDFSEIVEGMLALLKFAVSKHATLKTDFEKQLPKVRANAAKMSQLVMNLVMNASEAIGDRDGTIQVTTRRVTLGPDSLGIDRPAQGEYVQLRVSDTGRGMSPETLARVFEPFFSTKSAGRGLGMAVVYGIVRSLGGTIHLASELGHGTTILILLPCAEATSGAETSPISDDDEPARLAEVATILLVEDEYLLRQAASKLLHNRGFSVIEAPDGSAALDAIRAKGNPIDVLILDVTLPGTPGWEVLNEARRLRPGMRVVVTSAYTKEMAVASLQTTVERFIRKPYRLNDLVDLIQTKQ